MIRDRSLKGRSIDVAIQKLAFGGDGIGPCSVPNDALQREPALQTLSGRVTFVPNTIPGDRVKAALVKMRKNHLEARLECVVEASPLRITPRCRHFGVCGGCTWQNLAYADQLKFKEQIVRETLQHLGGFSAETLERVMRPVLGCRDPWYYRNKMELSFDQHAPPAEGRLFLSETDRKVCSDSEVRFRFRAAAGWPVKVGLHPRNHRYEVFDMEECFLQSEVLAQIAATMREFVSEHQLTVFKGSTGKGLLRSLIVREGKYTGERMAHLVTSGEPFPQVEAFREVFISSKWQGKSPPSLARRSEAKALERSDPLSAPISNLNIKPISAITQGHSASAPCLIAQTSLPKSKQNMNDSARKIHSLIWTRLIPEKGHRTRQETQVLWGQPVIHEELHLENGSCLRFEISAESFFQPNTRQAEVLYGQVIELAHLSGHELVYDLYCGTGTIGLFCAHRAKQVIGIESVAEAVKNARRNAEQNGVSNIEFFVGDVVKLKEGRLQWLPRSAPPLPDIVIVDPPRAGLAPSVPSAIANLHPKKIVYASCNPATLARDLKEFTRLGYLLQTVQPVDLFPHTTHIENVALLKT